MKHNSALFAPIHQPRPLFGSNAEFIVIAVCFCTGAITAISTEKLDLSSAMRALCPDNSAVSVQLLCELLGVSLFHLVAFLLGTSYAGCFFLPLVSGAYGFSVYSTAYRLLGEGLQRSLCLPVLSQLLLVPCFFVVAVDAFKASTALRDTFLRNRMPADRKRPLHLVFCLPFFVFAAMMFA